MNGTILILRVVTILGILGILVGVWLARRAVILTFAIVAGCFALDDLDRV